ncbi:MAG: O-antigen ligase family protein, partial [Anaerolineae bacterium]|nr:O-antigen ligase family protein [Anaerolineae bacterium]
HQADLGLTFLGELDLDPAISGVSVLMTDGQRWLRAYGLTGHPNLLAALLAPLMLYLMSQAKRAGGWERWTLLGIVGLGAVALVATASRAAWLAFAIGLAVWLAALWTERRQAGQSDPPGNGALLKSRRSAIAAAAVVGGLALLFLAVYGQLLMTRFFDLDTSIEARSILERERDWGIALQLIRQHPLAGVGMGGYLPEARAIDQAARVVHNVPLLVTAELGFVAGLLWIWLTAAPFGAAIGLGKRGWQRLTPGLAPWVAIVTMGLFHGLPWINTGWRAAILMALILGILANEISSSAVRKT